MTTPLNERPCRMCGHHGPHAITDGVAGHQAGVRCQACERHLGWLPKPRNIAKRRDRNHGHRRYWLEQHAGDLICACCGSRQSERPRVAFDIDHIVPLEDGGTDDERNTVPLCRDCHTIKNAIRAHRRHTLGLSARQEVSDAA